MILNTVKLIFYIAVIASIFTTFFIDNVFIDKL